jgi:putative ABC transport system permease protein
LLGILVGAASVVAIVSGGQLATARALQEIKKLGTNLIVASFNYTGRECGDHEETKVPLNTILNMKSKVPKIAKVAPYTPAYADIYFHGKPIKGEVAGITSDFVDVAKLTLLSGRFVSSLDKQAYYCTIGFDIYQQIRQYTMKPLGEQIKIGDTIFTIVGIANPSPQNTFMEVNAANTIFIPIRTSFLINPYVKINDTIIQTFPDAKLAITQKMIATYLQQHLRNQQVSFRNSAQLLSSMKKQQGIFTVFLGFIGGISLIVGGIGVMNIMLVAINERRHEIGIRRAIGAKRRDIQFLFLVEAIILALLGGTLGVIVGILASFIIAEARHWEFHIFLYPPLVGFVVSVLTGIFFGIYPAFKASRLNPIEALRAE